MGFPSSSLDEGIRKSQLLLKGKTTNPKDSGGNDQPTDKVLPSTVSDEGTGKTKPFYQKGHTSSEVELNTQTLLLIITADVQDLLMSDDELIEESDDDVFKASNEMDEDI
ncbi:hypothetical protein Tco_0347958 [Tanacetum coccineum]